VALTPDHQIARVIAGSLQSYNELAQIQLGHCFFPLSRKYDVVIVGNGGFPLDLNLYQAVKSMAIGELAVKEGGTIIAVNECREGVGHGDFGILLDKGITPVELYRGILTREINCKDQWQVQILARILQKARIQIVSSLQASELGTLGLIHAKSVDVALEDCTQRYGSQMAILVLPDGTGQIPL